MKNNFLDDDWLKEELTEEYIDDDNFSFSVVKKIEQHENINNRYFYLVIAFIITIIGYFLIPEFMVLLSEPLALFSDNQNQIMPMSQIELIGGIAILLIFILIWSFESFDLI